MSTPYKEKIKRSAEMTDLTYELLKKNNLKSRMGAVGSLYKCACCHDESEKWLTQFEAKKHIHTDKHKKSNKNYNAMKSKYENEYRMRLNCEERNKEIQKELFKYNGTHRVHEFLLECEEADDIHMSLDDEVSVDGEMITRPIFYISAPTTFNELYSNFQEWCDTLGESNISKENVKSIMIKFQDESAYGLEIGECEEYLKKNGTLESPKFNFKFEK